MQITWPPDRPPDAATRAWLGRLAPHLHDALRAGERLRQVPARGQLGQQLLDTLDLSAYRVEGAIAVHRSATVESGAVLKGPLIVGPDCFVAAGAYLRGGNWIAERCTFGPGAELKSSFVFAGTKLAHFNFVGDSILGADVNLEAGSIVCNYRNERADKEVRVRIASGLPMSPIMISRLAAIRLAPR